MNAQIRLPAVFPLIAGIFVFAAMTGCVCIVDKNRLDSVASLHPVTSDVDKVTREPLDVPFPAEKLWGKWEGNSEEQEIVWKHDGWWKRFECDSNRFVIEFTSDGNYTYKAYKNGKLVADVHGEYAYRINKHGFAELTMNGLKYPYRGVFWHGEKEMVILTFRSAKAAIAWRFDSLDTVYPKASWSNYINYKRDTCQNQLWISHHISANKGVGYRREYHESPISCKRVGAATYKAPQKSAMKQGQTRNKEMPAYDVTAIERIMDDDFSYQFELKLADGSDCTLGTIRTVKNDFRRNIKDDYAESFAGSSVASLFVEFPRFSFCDGKITGRAVVMNIVVRSMNYDPLTRTGHLSVLVNGNRFEETRKWIRRNIETLARDKNIALVTGEIPPVAKFYLGKEELKDGNLLEIEFKTE